MFCVENSQRITKYLLLSLLCFDSLFSATIESAQGPRGGENEGIQGELEDDVNSAGDVIIQHFDFFQFTTPKRYVWEDWTVPTRDTYYRERTTDPIFFYVMAGIAVGVLFVIAIACICRKNPNYSCFASSDSSASRDIFTTVHPPPQIRTVRNQYNGSTREHVVRDLYSELDSNGVASHANGATIAFINSTYPGPTPQPGSPISEKPPDYSTVTLSDLVNPARPAFPVVNPISETPPPEYGREIYFHK